jgi:hypothetical protein
MMIKNKTETGGDAMVLRDARHDAQIYPNMPETTWVPVAVGKRTNAPFDLGGVRSDHDID